MAGEQWLQQWPTLVAGQQAVMLAVGRWWPDVGGRMLVMLVGRMLVAGRWWSDVGGRMLVLDVETACWCPDGPISAKEYG
jgi:hypothetical protein